MPQTIALLVSLADTADLRAQINVFSDVCDDIHLFNGRTLDSKAFKAAIGEMRSGDTLALWDFNIFSDGLSAIRLEEIANTAGIVLDVHAAGIRTDRHLGRLTFKVAASFHGY